MADPLVTDDVHEGGPAGGEGPLERGPDVVRILHVLSVSSRAQRRCGRSGCLAGMSNCSVCPRSRGICSKDGPQELSFDSTATIGTLYWMVRLHIKTADAHAAVADQRDHRAPRAGQPGTDGHPYAVADWVRAARHR